MIAFARICAELVTARALQRSKPSAEASARVVELEAALADIIERETIETIESEVKAAARRAHFEAMLAERIDRESAKRNELTALAREASRGVAALYALAGWVAEQPLEGLQNGFNTALRELGHVHPTPSLDSFKAARDALAADHTTLRVVRDLLRRLDE